MKSYVMSIVGIILAGILIEIIVPSGKINKYIRSIYAIFVVAVIINPVLNFLNEGKNFEFTSSNFEMDNSLSKYIAESKKKAVIKNITNELETIGISGIDINLNYSIENFVITFNSCEINSKNMSKSKELNHINICKVILDVVQKYVPITDKELIWNE